jgi:hypothetical protein
LAGNAQWNVLGPKNGKEQTNSAQDESELLESWLPEAWVSELQTELADYRECNDHR